MGRLSLKFHDFGFGGMRRRGVRPRPPESRNVFVLSIRISIDAPLAAASITRFGGFHHARGGFHHAPSAVSTTHAAASTTRLAAWITRSAASITHHRRLPSRTRRLPPRAQGFVRRPPSRARRLGSRARSFIGGLHHAHGKNKCAPYGARILMF